MTRKSKRKILMEIKEGYWCDEFDSWFPQPCSHTHRKCEPGSLGATVIIRRGNRVKP